MNSTELAFRLAFLEGFLDDSDQSLHKQADLIPGVGPLTHHSSVLLDKLRLALMLAPALAGVGAGAAVSSLTAPSKLDIANAQRRLVSAELEEQLAEVRRQKLLRDLEKRNSGNTNDRSDSRNALRI